MARTIQEIRQSITDSLRQAGHRLSQSAAAEWRLWTDTVATPFALWTGNDAADARFVCTIKQRLENHFTVHVFDINRNACVDQAFMFIVMPTA